MPSVTVRFDASSENIRKRMLRVGVRNEIFDKHINRAVGKTLVSARTQATRRGTAGLVRNFLLAMSGAAGEKRSTVKSKKRGRMIVKKGVGIFWIRGLNWALHGLGVASGNKRGNVSASRRVLSSRINAKQGAFLIGKKGKKKNRIVLRKGNKIVNYAAQTREAVFSAFHRGAVVAKRKFLPNIRTAGLNALKEWRRSIGAK